MSYCKKHDEVFGVYCSGCAEEQSKNPSIAPLPVQEQGEKMDDWQFNEWIEVFKTYSQVNQGLKSEADIWNDLSKKYRLVLKEAPPASQPSYVGGEEEPPMVIYFETCGDQMEIKCPDEDGEFAICVKNKGARHFQIYAFPVDEAKGIAEFLLKHAKNADDAEAPSTPPDKEDKPVPEMPKDLKVWYIGESRKEPTSEAYKEWKRRGQELCYEVARTEGYQDASEAMYRHMDNKLCQNAWEWIQKCNELQDQLSSIKAERDAFKKSLEDRFDYLKEQESVAMRELDSLSRGSVERVAKWTFIRELGDRKSEVRDFLNKYPKTKTNG